MNAKQRMVLIAAVVVAGCLLARYLGYPEPERPNHYEWLSLAILAVAVGASSAVWFGGKR